MIRLLGLITGSALALAALLLVIGVPQFKTDSIDAPAAVVTLPVPTAAVDDAPPAAPPPTAAVETAPPDEPVDAESAAEVGEPPALPAAAEETTEPPEALNDAQQWYAFWSPFRSELAATGFVEELQRVTGLDYRVVRIRPGVYEVAFAYADDSDIGSKLSTISAATGLDLPPSQ